ncbi:MAG: FMN-binding protein [Vicinamibacterales bacterium]
MSVATVVVLYWVGFTRTEAARHFVFGRAAPRLHFVDGTYLGVGSSRHGRIRATVTVSRGRITAAAIADCRMRYPCEMIAALPPQVVARQSSEVDIVSGASDSSEAFWRAARDALSQAGSGTAAQGPGR